MYVYIGDKIGANWCGTNNYIMKYLIGISMVGFLVLSSVFFSAPDHTKEQAASSNARSPVLITKEKIGRVSSVVIRVSKNSSQSSPTTPSGYQHVWPEMRFGWRIVVGGMMGFLGAAFGSVGGVGGGVVYVPMLNLIIGFDEKSSIAMSKCMVVGGAAATVFYNLRQKHPTLDLPIIDYEMALLFQPMLMLGISLGVALNVIFADWMITLLIIIVFLVTSTKSFLKGIETWKKETIMKKEAALRLQSSGANSEKVKREVRILDNIYWKELGILIAVWIVILALQIAKNYTTTCSPPYWILNFLQVPITGGVTLYRAARLRRGEKATKGEVGREWSVKRLTVCSLVGIIAGTVGGLLGLGGGSIMGPLFLELGLIPQVSSATATLIMTFSSAISVVQYYLLKRFPVPYALFFSSVAIVSAVVGQFVAGKVIKALGRASLIIFILSSMIFISVFALGGIGIAKSVGKLHRKEYMGFEDICSHH